MYMYTVCGTCINQYPACSSPLQRQSRRVYEILRLRATDRSNPEEYKSYRLTVKNRLNGPYKVHVHVCTCTWGGQSTSGSSWRPWVRFPVVALYYSLSANLLLFVYRIRWHLHCMSALVQVTAITSALVQLGCYHWYSSTRGCYHQCSNTVGCYHS